MSAPPSRRASLALTSLALAAFAANSLLCRLALRAEAIDPASFTAIRLASGALTLVLLVRIRGQRPHSPSWFSPFYLALYAIPFAFAYLHLQAGTGALLLFGAVQCTMILGGWLEGHRLGWSEWLGLLIAFGGLAWLVAPGVSAPDPLSAALMVVAGLAWGFYSLRGRGAGAAALPLTAANFVRATPIAIVACLPFYPSLSATGHGVLLAILSGALASGVGYVIWYRALPGLAPVAASVVQLAVPLLAAFGGVALLGETMSWRLATATVLVLGGIALTLLSRRFP
ncbi:MAG TPA: DMT family transporter [Gemmatimonadales bacterium]|nr:DMT family transporter [Gemmatimonadales bacterium]